MFDVNTWQEILSTLWQNKLRTFLTGLSVAWGILILVVLLGAGQGLYNGVLYQFRDDAINSIWVRSGQTSVPHKGFKPGRYVQFVNGDHEAIAALEGVEHITSRFYLWGNVTVSYKSESGTYDVRTVHPGHQFLEKSIVTEGRFLNELDLAEYRKVAAIGEMVARDLFGRAPPIGKYIKVNGVAFKVIGLFRDDGAEHENQKVYLPITTAQRAFGGYERVHQIMFTTGSLELEKTQELAAKVRATLAERHNFALEDQRAVSVSNSNESFKQFADILFWINAFVWAVGIGTLLAGVVGVSNIMMIAVKDRTREIGVRKALGATPGSILKLIVLESILITSIAGYIGLVAGVAIIVLAFPFIPASDYFRNPEVRLQVALAATALLVAVGAVAGMIPAYRASRIAPVAALRDE